MRRCATIESWFLACMLALCALSESAAQESIFDLLTDLERKGDQYHSSGSFSQAIEVYEKIIRSEKGSPQVLLKKARAHFALRQYKEAVHWFREFEKMGGRFPDVDLISYAEALTGSNDYPASLERYASYSSRHPEDDWVKRRIWRLRNAQYLFEDSLHYSVRYLPINSDGDEFGAVQVGNNLLFLSNDCKPQGVQPVDAATNSFFYKLFEVDSRNGDAFGSRRPWGNPVRSRFHNGPFAFFHNDQKMVFSASAQRRNAGGLRPMHLFFAELVNGKWKIASAFPYNEPGSSCSDPFISSDGSVLYFSSDRKGGFGGKDLYRSEYQGGKWQNPVNLGPVVNTRYDETFPFVSEGYLYFSSNGHAGLGGIDIFKSALQEAGFGEVANLGHPVNTFADDFGLRLSRESYHGYFSSTRKNGRDADVYELLIDQQTYPIAIEGIIRQRENSWLNTDSLKVLRGASLFLVDHTRNITIAQTTSDNDGKFSLNIPYFSFYRVRVVQDNGLEAVVSLEIPRKRKEDYFHEMVIIKDSFSEPSGSKSND